MRLCIVPPSVTYCVIVLCECLWIGYAKWAESIYIGNFEEEKAIAF